MHRFLTKPTLFVLGWVFVFLGTVGVVLPLLPTTPFMILAAACFAKSSPRFHKWLLDNRWFGQDLKQWEETKTVSHKVKPRATALIILTFSISIAILHGRIELQLMLVGIASILLFFIWRLKEHEAVIEHKNKVEKDESSNS